MKSLLVLGYFLFGIDLSRALSVDKPAQNVFISGVTLGLYIPAQNVSSNQEIKWTKPKNLNGSYHMVLAIFPSNPVQEGEVSFSIGKGDTFSVCNVPFSNISPPEFTINQIVKINPDDKLILSFFSKYAILKIKKEPRSYIYLTRIHHAIGQTGIPDTTVRRSGSMKKNTMNISVFVICVMFCMLFL